MSTRAPDYKDAMFLHYVRRGLPQAVKDFLVQEEDAPLQPILSRALAIAAFQKNEKMIDILKAAGGNIGSALNDVAYDIESLDDTQTIPPLASGDDAPPRTRAELQQARDSLLSYMGDLPLPLSGSRTAIPARTPEQRLIEAVRQGDRDAVKKLIADGADPDYDQGLALRTAAGKEDSGMMDTLLLAGAHPAIAEQGAQQHKEKAEEAYGIANNDAYRYRRNYDFDDDFVDDESSPDEKVEEARTAYETAERILRFLKEHKEKFFKETLPLIQARAQVETLAEIRALRAEMTASSPARLEKLAVRAPRLQVPGGGA